MVQMQMRFARRACIAMSQQNRNVFEATFTRARSQRVGALLMHANVRAFRWP